MSSRTWSISPAARRPRAIFPPPLYELPDDLIFEATGIVQFPLAVAATVLTIAMLRRA